MFIRRYRFEHPKTERSVTLRGRSYIWAGLFGAAYVWRVGYGSVPKALAINVVFVVGVVAVALGSSILQPIYQLFILVALPPVALYVHGSMMISLIRTGFRRRGWMTRLA